MASVETRFARWSRTTFARCSSRASPESLLDGMGAVRGRVRQRGWGKDVEISRLWIPREVDHEDIAFRAASSDPLGGDRRPDVARNCERTGPLRLIPFRRHQQPIAAGCHWRSWI
jgi:hypothetical protein